MSEKPTPSHPEFTNLLLVGTLTARGGRIDNIRAESHPSRVAVDLASLDLPWLVKGLREFADELEELEKLHPQRGRNCRKLASGVLSAFNGGILRKIDAEYMIVKGDVRTTRDAARRGRGSWVGR